MGILPHQFSKKIFYQFVKSSELVMVYINILSFIIYGNFKWLFLGISLIVSGFINYYLKNNIAYPLFKNNNHILPILGPGLRPEGAEDCGYYSNCPKLLAKSYGFPSGHSQFAGFQCGFLIKDIMDRKTKDGKFSSLKFEDKISVVMLFMSVIIMMYSRVFIEGCHTIQQAIFGAIIGLFLGYYAYNLYIYFESKILFRYPNFFNKWMPYIKLLFTFIIVYSGF
tara:strand:- start:1398 stop:2069 length:672 start_codon:yes stop_codon:yes gene_type:complete